MITNKLANMCKINIAEGQIMRLSSTHHTYLTKRFDRTSDNTRIHFASAMTLLGYTDSTDFHDGASYLEIAQFIIKNGAQVNSDLEELWKRIIFFERIKHYSQGAHSNSKLIGISSWPFPYSQLLP